MKTTTLTIRDIASFLFKKEPNLTFEEIHRILYIADLDHFLSFGRTITGIGDRDSYELKLSTVREALKQRNKLYHKKELVYLSDSDEECLKRAYLIFGLEQTGDMHPIPDKILFTID